MLRSIVGVFISAIAVAIFLTAPFFLAITVLSLATGIVSCISSLV